MAAAVTVEHERTQAQDIAYGVRHLTDVANTALSPGSTTRRRRFTPSVSTDEERAGVEELLQALVALLSADRGAAGPGPVVAVDGAAAVRER